MGGDRRREGQDEDQDPAVHDPALAHLLEILGHHAHKPEAKQGGKRRLETTSSVDKDHGCTNVAYVNMVFGKDYYHTIEDLGSPANPTDGWPLCARECNNDRDCLAWDWTLCVGNAKMCCNLIHTHYFIEDLQWRHNSLVNVDYYRSFSGIPCAPRYIYDIPEGKIFSLTSDIYSTVTWEIRNEVWTYDTVVGAGCRVKTAGDITRQPSESDSDLLVVPPGTDAYRVHIDNEDFWNKSYCQKVTCEETSLNEKRYAELHGQPIPEYAWTHAHWGSKKGIVVVSLDSSNVPMWTRTANCWDKAYELYGWRDHISSSN